jgi:uncharacterized membrane protein
LLRYRLVSSLIFQRAAAIIETSIAPTLQEIGQLGAFRGNTNPPSFFVQRDLAGLRERDAEPLKLIHL